MNYTLLQLICRGARAFRVRPILLLYLHHVQVPGTQVSSMYTTQKPHVPAAGALTFSSKRKAVEVSNCSIRISNVRTKRAAVYHTRDQRTLHQRWLHTSSRIPTRFTIQSLCKTKNGYLPILQQRIERNHVFHRYE
jgi:hypothetical protein